MVYSSSYSSSIKPQRLNYQHCFAIFDLELNLLRYSELFKFENAKVEYAISLILQNNQMIIGYSTLDNNSKIGIYSYDSIQNLNWYINSSNVQKDTQVKINIISLIRDKKRRQMCNQLMYLNKNIKLFDAIDSHDTDLITRLKKTHQVNLVSNGATGCALSHIILLKKNLESTEKYMIVLEDDCIILNKLPETNQEVDMIFSEINTTHENTDILYLISKPLECNEKFEVTCAIGTYGYLVTKHGAKKIIEVCKNMNIPIDWVIEANCVYGRKIIQDKYKMSTSVKIRAYRSQKQYIGHNNELLSNIS